MPCMIWLLPDFVGHPLCFSVLAPRVAEWGKLRLFSYHSYWPYASIEQLAVAIAADADSQRPDWVLGYSFGGLVGCEIARHLVAGGGPAPRLLLIDSRLPAPDHEGAATDLAQLGLQPKYRQLQDKIELLVALGEVVSDCIVANLHCFPTYRPGGSLAGVDLIAGRSGGEDYKSIESWRMFLPDSRLWQVDVAHQDMLIDPSALETILSILTAG